MKRRVAINLTKNKQTFRSIIETIRAKCGKKANALDLIFCPDEETLREMVIGCEVVACYDFLKPVLERADHIRWLHLGSAGIEHTLYPELIRSQIMITNSRGIHGIPMSEFVMAAMLNYSKRFDRCRQLRTDRQWQKWEVAKTLITLSGKTVGLLGYGAVGKAVAEKAKAFGMKVWVYKLNPVPGPDVRVDRFFYGSELKKMMSGSDFVVILLPLTSKTKKMLTRKELSWMKPTAYLINVSRGKIIDQTVLSEMLRKNKIAGAFLDVFEEEPLPAADPLYELSNVFLTPHISGNFPEYVHRVGDIFADNMNRYLNGQPLINIYDRHLEY